MTVHFHDLKDAIEIQYDIHFKDDEEFRRLLGYSTTLDITDTEPSIWLTEEENRIQKLTKMYLQDIFPSQQFIEIK